jgi:hypothetical protein
MKPAGKEFQSKLSLARSQLLADAIERYRRAEVNGIKVQLEILATPGCFVSEVYAGRASRIPYSGLQLYTRLWLPLQPCDGAGRT